MLDTYPTPAQVSNARALGLISRSGGGPSIMEVLRQMMRDANGGPARRSAPSSVLGQRDLTASAAASGGYLVGTTTRPMASLMERYSVLREAGLQIVDGLQGDVVLPYLKTGAAGGWLSAEGQTITEGAPVFGQVAHRPKYYALKVDISRQLVLQTEADVVASAVIEDATAKGVDAAVIAGTGASGQPLGLVNTAGVNAQPGAALAWAGILSMQEQVLLAGAREDRLMWLGHPTVQKVLSGRERAAGSGFIWEDGRINGRPAVATASVPAGTLIVGDWSRSTVSVFDAAGVGVEYNPYEDFRAGIASFRLILPLDVGIAPAAAFSVATSVS